MSDQTGAVFNIAAGTLDVLFKKIAYPDNGTLKYGAQFDVWFYSTSNEYKSYNWIQTYYEIDDGVYSSSFDGAAAADQLSNPFSTYPFYYDSKNYLDQAPLARATSYFTDSPASILSSRSFYATTTLIGIGYNDQFTVLGSFKWGYTSYGTNIQLSGYSFSTSTNNQQNNALINYYNAPSQ